MLDMGTERKSVDGAGEQFEGHDRQSGELKWTGTRADLVFGSNAYAGDRRGLRQHGQPSEVCG